MGKAITKGEFIKALSEKVGLSQAKTSEVINTTIDSITAELQAGNSVVLTGFGKFDISKRAARKGRNPGTGAAINIPASTVPVFRAGATFKSAING